MKFTVKQFIFAGISVLFACSSLLAQAPATQPASPNPGVTSDEHVIDKLDISSPIPLGEFFAMLKKKEPTFQYVAMPGDWQSFELPPLYLRNVTVAQVFVLLSRITGKLTVDPIQDAYAHGGEILYLLRDRPQQAALFAADPGYTRVMAFGLADTIDRLALRKARDKNEVVNPEKSSQQFAASRKEALEDILSLLQAAITQSSEPSQGQAEPTLKLHKETEVLLVKGTNKQLEAVANALDALKRDLAAWQGKTFSP